MKKRLKPLAICVLTAFLLLVIYQMFKGNWSEIAGVLLGCRPAFLILLFALGLAWYAMDALVYGILFRAEGTPLSAFACVRTAMISIFCDVTTMGAGTKPAQVWYCHRQGAAIGSCAGILTLPYLVQKLLIVAFSLCALAGQRSFIERSFGSAVRYIYLGAAGSIAITVVLGLVCVCAPVHRAILFLIGKIFRGERWAELNAAVERQLETLAKCSRKILQSPKTSAKIALIMAAKLLILYSIPAAALMALFGNLQGVSLVQVITMSAVMKLIMGVIPTSGGVGSLEVVFALLFKAVFGSVTGASIMVLFRAATYYFPFLISLGLVRGLLAQKAKDEPKGQK